ncbi:hypothetical protein JTB14_007151 [Gonioctena quinquepunctata]|nr:hypothetical protein JTB14_007151 [Gonioctena quinquepunctata]
MSDSENEMLIMALMDRPDEKTPLSISTRKTRSSKHSIVSLEKKKLAIETEKRKPELERKRSQIQFEMEQKQKEIYNSMRKVNHPVFDT